MNPSEFPVLDSEALPLALETREEAVLREFYELYLSQLEELRSSQAMAVRSGDRRSIRLLAHKMKSSSLAVGAMCLGQLLSELEERCESLSGADFEVLLELVDRTVEHTRDALNARLECPAS